jgi:hypothetical protein
MGQQLRSQHSKKKILFVIIAVACPSFAEIMRDAMRACYVELLFFSFGGKDQTFWSKTCMS